VIRLWVKRLGPNFRQGWIFSATASRPALGPTSLLSSGYRDLFSRGKSAGAWSWPLTLSSAEVKNVWSYTSTRPSVFLAWCWIKQGLYFHGMQTLYLTPTDAIPDVITTFSDSNDTHLLLVSLFASLPFVQSSSRCINTSLSCHAVKVKIDSRWLWKWKE